MSDSNDSQNDRISPLGCVTKLSDYILKSREERTAHIDLTTECVLGGDGHRKKHILLDYLQLTNDVDNWTRARIHRCHMCEHGRRNGWCVNPQHFYFGTASENQLDLPKEFRVKRGSLSSTKSQPWSSTKEAKSRFFQDCSDNPCVLAQTSRELAEVYKVSHFTIQRWKRDYEFTQSA